MDGKNPNYDSPDETSANAKWSSKELFALRWPHRKFLKRLKRKKLLAAKRRRGGADSYRSHFLSYCIARLRGKDLSFREEQKGRKTLVVPVPAVFSFIDNAEEALNILYTMTRVADASGFRRCDIDHSECERLDMGASVAFDILVMELDRKWTSRCSAKGFVGHYPRSESVMNVIRGSGVVKHLCVKDQELSPKAKSNYIYLPLQKGFKPSASQVRSTTQEKVAEKVALHFNECLNTRQFALTPEGLKYISQLVGEVIDNAEEHSGQDRWFAIGYMDQSQEIGECQLSIVNFGWTIFETLKTGDPTLQKEIAALAHRHRAKGLFAPTWTEESLWTLYALQDGVSRWTHTDLGADRGIGTVKMIQFFQQLGDTTRPDKHPMMTLVSGSTQILFDNEFKIQPTKLGSETRQVIAFNKENSLEEKPSPKHVHSLQGFFPGVLISMRFYIDKNYLQQITND